MEHRRQNLDQDLETTGTQNFRYFVLDIWSITDEEFKLEIWCMSPGTIQAKFLTKTKL